jgi:hypothetical protein
MKPIEKRLKQAGFTRINFSWPGHANVLYFKESIYHVGAVGAATARAKRAWWYLLKNKS